MNRVPSSQASSSASSDDEIDLLEVIQVIWRERLLVLWSTVIPMSLAFGLYVLQPQLRVAEVTVFPLERNWDHAVSSLADEAMDPVDAELNDPRNYRMPDLADVLESRDLATRVAERIRTDLYPEGAATANDLADRLQGMVDIAQHPESHALIVQARAASPDVAVGVADAYVAGLQDYMDEVARDHASRKRAWVERQMAVNLQALDAGKQKLALLQAGRAAGAEREHLARDLATRQALYVQLFKQREAAILAESKISAEFVSNDKAVALSKPKKSRLILLVPFAALAGLTLGVFLAFLRLRLTGSPASA